MMEHGLSSMVDGLFSIVTCCIGDQVAELGERYAILQREMDEKMCEWEGMQI